MKNPPGTRPPALHWAGQQIGERHYVITAVYYGSHDDHAWATQRTIVGVPGTVDFIQQCRAAVCRIENMWVDELGRRYHRGLEFGMLA